MDEHTYIICMGSNLADASMRVEEALRAVLVASRSMVMASRGMTTQPVGFHNPAPFVNMLAVVRSELSPQGLQQKLKAIETAAGRRAGDKRRGRVVVDLDVVVCDGRVLRPDDWARHYVRVLAWELGLQVG